MGVAVESLTSGETFSIDADRTFNSASLYKLFDLEAAEAAIAAGSLDPSKPLTLTAADPYSDL